MKNRLLIAAFRVEDSERHIVETVDARSFFRAKTDEAANEKSLKGLRQAFSAFDRFWGGGALGFGDFTREAILEWSCRMLYEGYTQKTSVYYLRNLSALYGRAVKEGIAAENDVFGRTISKIMGLSPAMFVEKRDSSVVEKLQRLVRLNAGGSGESALSRDLVIFSVLNGGLRFDELAYFKKDDYKGGDPAIIEIVDRYSKPKNKYLFPLKQSERTPKQMRAFLKDRFSDALSLVGISLSNPADDTALELWCATALRCNAGVSTVLGCAGRRPISDPVFALADPREVTADERGRIMAMVSHAIVDNPREWHAMQLRPTVDYGKLTARLKLCEKDIRIPEMYYPCEEIAKRIGRRLVYKNRPVISGLVFFKSRMSDISPLFRCIGDLAWCYREGKDVGSPYAVIPQSQMRLYQTTIGIFTPRTEIFPAGAITLEKGDRVEVIGGSFLGRMGKFGTVLTKNKGTEAARTVYRLLLPDNNGIEWVVDTDPCLVRKITDERYRSFINELN